MIATKYWKEIIKKMFNKLVSLAALASASDFSDIDKTFSQICFENGFDFETHSVTTEDGYIL